MKRRILTVIMVLSIAAGMALARSPKHKAHKLPLPTQQRVVLHGVQLDIEHGTIRPESTAILDTAADLLNEAHSRMEVVILTEPLYEAVNADSSATVCGEEIVRNYLADRGVPMARLVTVSVPPPQPPSLIALASDGTAQCRVGFVVD